MDAESRIREDMRQDEYLNNEQLDSDLVEESGIAAQTDILSEDLDAATVALQQEVNKVKKERDALKEENAILKEKLESMQSEMKKLSFDQEYLKNNDKKVLYYTGLSTWSLLMTLFMFIKPHLHTTGKSSLSPFQQLMMTLMRLRLNLTTKDLGYRFNVHNSTISRIFNRVINIMSVRLSKLIRWPDRDALLKTMPITFRKHYPRCIVIIDCFEIFLDRPTNLLARAQTYSSYKHHNTVKYLIGITPQHRRRQA